MNQRTREINKITGTVIAISIRLILLLLFIALLYQGVTRGYEFGHQVFYGTAMEKAPGHDKEIILKEGISPKETARILKEQGLISNEYSFMIQARFFDYRINPGSYILNTSMTSRDILQIMNEGSEGEDGSNDSK